MGRKVGRGWQKRKCKFTDTFVTEFDNISRKFSLPSKNLFPPPPKKKINFFLN